MMKFLRKHQKKLFIVITVMIIASFTFFGTFNGMNTREIPDKEISKALDGSSIMDRELYAMIRFLTLGSNEVLNNDLMVMLAERYFDEIKDEFSEKLDRAKRFTPYTHPQAPFLSAIQVWNRFVPQLPHRLNELKNSDLSPKSFALYSQLYLDQAEFPPELMSRILLYQQQQYSWISPDRELADPRRLALFGAQSFEEWFGPRFTEVLGKFIFNAAIIAEKKGYKVSTDEARANLLQTCLQTLSQKQQATYADASEFLRHQIQMVGIDESQAVKTWKKVILAHRLFNNVSQGMLVDSLSYRQFSSFADEKAVALVYQLPEVLRLTDSRSLHKLHYYLDAVAPKMKNGDLPRQFFAPEEVEKHTPELVVQRYELEMAKVTKEEVGSRLTLKETWDYEVSDEGWKECVTKFPVLARDEDRFKILEAIEPSVRLKIDRFARSLLIDLHPEWIEEALEKTTAEKTTVAIRLRGSTPSFGEIEDPTALLKFLENAPLGIEAPLFTNDDQTYYRIVVWTKPSSKEVMTCKEAQDWLGELVDAKLQTAYPDIRKKNPDLFKLPNGSWKSFSDVRDQIGDLVYADRFPPSTLMEKAKKSILTEGEESPFLKITGQPLVDQWKLVLQTKEIKRSESTTLSKEELFSLPEGGWSSISTPPNGDLAFFRVVRREVAPTSVEDKITDGQRHLSTDAKRLLMHQILETINAS